MDDHIMKTEGKRKTFTEEISGTVSEVISQVKKLIREGNARRVIIQDKNGKVLFQSQLTIGVGGITLLTAIAPIVSAISMFAIMMNDIKIIVERYPEGEGGEPEDEYEVEADVIEIRDEDEDEQAEEQETSDSSETKEENDKTDKTVGKKDENEKDSDQ